MSRYTGHYQQTGTSYIRDNEIDGKDKVIAIVCRGPKCEERTRRIAACLEFCKEIKTEDMTSGEYKIALYNIKTYIRPCFPIPEDHEV
jgi:hypothetical protein